MTSVKLNLGFEYYILKNNLSLGLVSHSKLFKGILTEEITSSINAKPNEWINATLSYSLFNGMFSTFGAAFGIRTGIIHWFAAADYIPSQKTTLALSDLGINFSSISIPIPYNSKLLNFSCGMNIVFDRPEMIERKSIENKIRKFEGLRNTNPFSKFNTNINKKTSSSTTSKIKSKSTGLHKSINNNDCNCEWDK